jgi:hypothetical protein
MRDFGTPDERAAALRVAEACQALNNAISDASHVGVNVKIVDLEEDWDSPSRFQIHRMERRTMILPTPPGGDVGHVSTPEVKP